MLEAKARFTRLQGTTRVQLTHARDRALLAVVDCHLASRRAEKEGAVAGEAGADLALRRERFFADEGFFVPHAEAGLISMANSGADTDMASSFDARQIDMGAVQGSAEPELSAALFWVYEHAKARWRRRSSRAPTPACQSA